MGIRTINRGRLAAELARLRLVGISKLRSTDLPELRLVTRDVIGSDDPAAVERLLGQASRGLGGGLMTDAALVLFGLAQGTRGRRTGDLRRMAADLFEVQPETFRKGREKQIFEQLVEQLVGLVVLEAVTPKPNGENVADRQARLERLAQEIADLPASDLGLLVPILQSRLNYMKN